MDIHGNSNSHTLANTGDNLPMDLPPPNPHDIVLHGHIMPTPAKSWIMQLRHGGSVQVRLALCPTWAVLWTEWRQWWNEWATYTHTWLRTASDHDKWLCARLLIPLSLLKVVPQWDRYRLRSVAGLFQFRAILGVHELRRRIGAPTPNLPPSPPWITRFAARHYTPRETPQNLHNMVGARSGTSRKWKRSHEHDQPMIEVDTWLQEAQLANDKEAVRWFTHIILHHRTTTKHSYKKPKTLNMPHNP